METIGLSLRAQRSNLVNNLTRWIASSLALLAMTMLFSFSSIYANSAVQTIQSTYQSISDLQADFVQSTHVAILGKTVKERGIFSMKKPGQLRIEYKGEHPRQYISDGKKLWIVDPELEQVETYKISANTVPKEALELLKGFADMEKLFIINGWKPKRRLQNHSYLRLVPKNAKAQYNWLDCEFGPDNILKTMVIHNKSENVSTYIFSSVKLNTGLSDDLFSFKN